MRVEIDLESCAARYAAECRPHRVGAKTLYLSQNAAPIDSVDELRDAEYAQAVELDPLRRTIRFGRDYLGHFPLLYACTAKTLCLSDDLGWILGVLKSEGVRLALSEEAIALYLAMGYVPAGMTIYREVVACEAHSLYRWRRGRVEKTSTFVPVEADAGCGLPELRSAIEADVARWAAGAPEIDVWCSGGLDSSIMACVFNADGRQAELLTIGYGRDIHETLGDGERSFAYSVADHCGARIREVELSARAFERSHERFAATHPIPVIDSCVPPKYALADASRGFVITGEGSDPLFGGPKNNTMIFAQSKGPAVNLGWHYAMSHARAFPLLGRLLRRGSALSQYVVDEMNGLLGRYPGELIRRLFYINTHVKAASLIFGESYYALRRRAGAVRHPYAGLAVYRAAFALEDRLKYSYPRDKLALHELYAGRLPRRIVERKKSGTVLPLRVYLRTFDPRKFDFAPLRESGLFAEVWLEHLVETRETQEDIRPLYGLLTLSEWLKAAAAVPAAKPSREAADTLHDGAAEPRGTRVRSTTYAA